MTTGVRVADDLIGSYNQFKLSSNKGRYMIFKISDDEKLIVVEKISESNNFAEYFADLTGYKNNDGSKGIPRYSVIKIAYVSNDDMYRPAEKLLIVTW
jgi:cofilin